MTVSLILNVVLFITVLFLGREMMKKFSFFQEFIKRADRLVVAWRYPGIVAEHLRKPGMYKIRLKGDKPFSVLIGFHISVSFFGSGFDYFGFAESTLTGGVNNDIIIETWLGRNEVLFYFLVNHDADDISVEVIPKEEARATAIDVRYPPHWWQRLGIYA